MKVPRLLIQGLCVCALTAAFAIPASAQRGKWWHDDSFRRELGLTADQSTRLEDIFQKTQPTLRERMRALDEAERKFDELVEKGDEASVLGYVGTVESARAELSKARTLMLLRMRHTLTADQWEKLRALADRRDRGRSTERRRR